MPRLNSDIYVPSTHLKRMKEAPYTPGKKMDFSGTTVLADRVVKADVITITGPTTILFDFRNAVSVQDQCNAIVAKSLVFAPVDSGVSSLRIGIHVVDEEWQRAYVGGSPGSKGKTGSPDWGPRDPNSDAPARNGGDGSKGSDGREGTWQELLFMYLFASRVSGPWGEGIPNSSTLFLDRTGLPGGNGGSGGKGGRGGNGEQGSPSAGFAQGYGDCHQGAGRGGNSGHAGRGGSGGPGSQGGAGGYIFILSDSSETLRQLESVRTVIAPGRPGVGGSPGADGDLGTPGRSGKVFAPCQSASAGDQLGHAGPQPTKGLDGRQGYPGQVMLGPFTKLDDIF